MNTWRVVTRTGTCGLLLFAFLMVSSTVMARTGRAAQDDGAPGALAPTDRELLVVVRYANLWEIPVSHEAAERGDSEKTRQAGTILARDHLQLDVAVKQLAGQFGVALPEEPTSPQKAWIEEILSKSGGDFDRTYANRVRAAHGTIFGLVAEVRAGTGNDAVRSFAQQANDVVMKHMTLLEGIGSVLPHSLYAEASARTLHNRENQLAEKDYVLAVVMGLAAIAATLGIVRILGSPQRTGR